MRKLILIKHAPPLVLPSVPSEQWKLSDKGRGLCGPLAEAIKSHAPTVIVSSEEPKASETAQIVAERLNIPWRIATGLHEHDRSNVPHMRSGDFISMMELFFRKPTERILGRESAQEARIRFTTAVDRTLADHEGNVAIVSHGTVIALMLEAIGERRGFQIWREMGLPSFAVTSAEDRAELEIVNQIA